MIRFLGVAALAGYFSGKAWIAYTNGPLPLEFWMGGSFVAAVLSIAGLLNSKGKIQPVVYGIGCALSGIGGYLFAAL